MKRTLVLRRESLADLTTTELAALAGAGPDTTTGPQPTPPQYVVTYTCTRTNVVCLPSRPNC